MWRPARTAFHAIVAGRNIIARMRHYDSYNHTLLDIADGLEISPEQVREIERGALLKLKGAA